MDTSEREIGHFPISIGTSLAIEGALGIHPDNKKKKQLHRYKALYVNVETLFRNLYGAVPTAHKDKITVNDYAQALAQEISIISAIVNEETKGYTTTVFYINDQSDLNKKLPKAKFKERFTDKQKLMLELKRLVLENTPSLLDENQQIIIYKNKLSGKIPTLVLTHQPTDLLSVYEFPRLDLLESHTGEIRNKSTWWKKLHLGKNDTLPFNAFTLQVFGDNHYIDPQPAKIRKEVVDLSLKHKWTQTTSIGTIRMGVSGIQDKENRDTLRALLDNRSIFT